jgi:multimeric flavodoxin WrbA
VSNNEGVVVKITALYGSPRKNGNTDLLLAEFVRGARENGGLIHEIFLRDHTFMPCIECGACYETGLCILKDDMEIIYPHLGDSPVICLAAPIFFYNVNAGTKALIDRCQAFWARKYLLNTPASKDRGCKGKGYFLSAGGSRGKRTFDGVLLTIRYFYDALDMEFADKLLYQELDAKGAIQNHPTALREAYELGMSVTNL